MSRTDTIRVHRFDAHDLPWINVQAAQRDDWIANDNALIERGRMFAHFEHCFTIRRSDGTILLCIGLIEHLPGNFSAWSILSAFAGPHMVAITRWCRDYLNGIEFRRVQMHVRAGFVNAHRWARQLGFVEECVQPDWYADGAAQFIYAMRRKGVNHG